MADNETKPSANDGREELVAKQLASTKIHLALTQKRVDVSGAIKLPLERIPQLGVAFASLRSMFRTVTNTVSVPTLLQATDKYGSPLDPSKLNTFKDGSGLTGGYRDAAKGLGQARFHVVEGDIATSVTQVPYDPTSLFMAAAIAQINQKLDSIQESVDEMFEYMRQRDKANMRGNLKTLADILNGYGLNYGNATYMANAHMKVLDIKQSSAQDMELFRSQAQADLKKKGFIEVRDGLGRRLDKVLDYLKDCQLATYIHAFSLFLEPMLAQNFEPAKLADATAKIEADSIAYRELYTDCYNALEAGAVDTVDAALLGGIASAGKLLGHAIAKTPVGDHTLIDEALEGAGESIGKFNDKQSEKLLEKLHQAKTPDVTPFKQSVKEIDTLYNRPAQIAVDDRHAPCRQLTPLPSRRLQLQQQVAQLGALARKARLSSLAHPPPLADFLGARAHAVVPVHHLLEQLGGHARIGKGAVGVTRRLVELDAKPRRRVTQRDAPVAAHVHDRGVKRLQVGPVRRKCGKINVLCLALGQKLSTIRPAPANYLGGVATDPIAEPFDHHVERIGHRGVHGRYPRKLADRERNAFGKFRLHTLRKLAHNVAVIVELDGADLDNLVAQPTALALLWHRRKLKVQHNLARKVRRIDSRDTRRLFS